MPFCENLKRCRERAGLTRKDIAEKIHMTANGYGLYETGRSEPSLGVLCKIASILRTSTDDLLGMKDWKIWKTREDKGESDATPLTMCGVARELERMDATHTMSTVLCRTLRDLVCENQEEPDCRECPLRSVDCYNTYNNAPMQAVLMGLFGKHHAKNGEDKKNGMPLKRSRIACKAIRTQNEYKLLCR